MNRRFFGHPCGIALLFIWTFVLPTAAASDGAQDIMVGKYEIAVKDCRQQMQAGGSVDDCMATLRELEAQLSTADSDALREVRAQVGYRMAITEAFKQAGQKQQENPDDYFRVLLKAYASVPDKYFPYDEVLPMWNLYLRTDAGRTRFAKYRKVRMILRSPKGDKTIVDVFNKEIQQLLLDFGFDLLDPSFASSGRPTVLFKANIRGEEANDVMDPKLAAKKVYRIALDVQSLKFLRANKSIKVEEEELMVGDNFMENAREKAIKQGCARLTHILFYHSLRQMFRPSSLSD